MRFKSGDLPKKTPYIFVICGEQVQTDSFYRKKSSFSFTCNLSDYKFQNLIKMEKKILISLLFFLVSLSVSAQYISKILEYKPAPGQQINKKPWGVPESLSPTTSIVGRLNGAMSLGAFGGYVIFKFKNSVENHKDNPYGIDFVIYGNPLRANGYERVTFSEPGIVSVMKDENNNGKADDTWYELAGSAYFFESTEKNYSVTYTNPKSESAEDVPWTDNKGNSGVIKKNQFHKQPYYPKTSLFPDINTNKYTLTGTKINDLVDKSNSEMVHSFDRHWGYADNGLRGTYNGLPDNPYTRNIVENSGGDAFDISWAVDKNGNYVDLDKIDFVKVHSAVLADAGWLGEISTEITGAFDVAPNPAITGETDMVVLPEQRDTIFQPEAYFKAFAYEKGRYNPDKEIVLNINNKVATKIESNLVKFMKSGTFLLTAALKDRPEIKDTVSIWVKILEIKENINDTSIYLSESPLSLDLSELFTDPEAPRSELILSIDTNYNTAIISAKLQNKLLTVKPLKKGIASLTIRAKSKKKEGVKQIAFFVNEKKHLSIANEISDFSVEIGDEKRVDLSALFTSDNEKNDSIKISVTNNSNPKIAKAKIKDKVLIINPLSEGKIKITLTASLEEEKLPFSFFIEVKKKSLWVESKQKNKDLPLVFPNPANDYFVIKNAENMQVSIFSFTGKIVKNIAKYSKNKVVKIQDLQQGIYFIRISNEQFLFTIRFIKQ